MPIIDVGMNASDVYALLSQKGTLSLREIGDFLHRSEASIFLSLGWLLRENKISILDQNGKLFFELKRTLTEIYY